LRTSIGLVKVLKKGTPATWSAHYYEFKQHTSWFDKDYSKLLDRRKQTKFQWMQNPSQINGDNVKNEIRETSVIFKKKSGNVWKIKLMNSKQTVSDTYEEA